jgi:hypothetical protein
VRHVHGERWVHIVARRVAVEAGLAFQHCTAGLSDTNTWGVHLGAHADFPLLPREGPATPFIRLVAQRTFLFDTGDKISVLLRHFTGTVEPGTPPLQILFAFGVAW